MSLYQLIFFAAVFMSLNEFIVCELYQNEIKSSQLNISIIDLISYPSLPTFQFLRKFIFKLITNFIDLLDQIGVSRDISNL